MKVYTLVITQCQDFEVSLLNVIMKNNPAEIAKIIDQRLEVKNDLVNLTNPAGV